MYDILIKNDGRANLDTYDLSVASYERYLAQKIYIAVMDMRPGLFSGISIGRKSELHLAIKQYFTQYFATDPYIDGRKIEVVLKDSSIAQGTYFEIGYTTKDPNGKTVTSTRGFSYSFAAGALMSVDLEPSWLGNPVRSITQTINHYINIREITNEIELPVQPYANTWIDPDRGNSPVYGSVYLLYDTMVNSVSSRSVPFSIVVTENRVLYPISRFVNGFDPTLEIITEVNVTSGSSYQISNINGEYSLISRVPGTIAGTITIMTALQSTNNIYVRETVAGSEVYPLRPSRGQYVAVFPKTVSPGDYVVQYSGIVKE